MRILIQRVKNASVTIDGEEKSRISGGLLALVGFCDGDKEEYIRPMAEKMANLRIFEDENEKMNLSCIDIDGEILAVSQFTLYADCSHGRRPSFTNAMKPDPANEYYEKFVKILEEITGKEVKTGEFGADMKVELLNDGPVTVMLDSADMSFAK